MSNINNYQLAESRKTVIDRNIADFGLQDVGTLIFGAPVYLRIKNNGEVYYNGNNTDIIATDASFATALQTFMATIQTVLDNRLNAAAVDAQTEAQDIVDRATGSNMSDAQCVAADKSGLISNDFSFAEGDSASMVTGDFTMPTSGPRGTTVSWISNHAAVGVSEGTATVTRQASDTIVTLTATITKGAESDTKDIQVTVLQEIIVVPSRPELTVPSGVELEWVDSETQVAQTVEGCSVADPDTTGDLICNLVVTNGTLAVPQTSGAIVVIDGNTNIQITGPIIQINEELGGLTFTPLYNAGTPINGSINWTLNDQDESTPNTVDTTIVLVVDGGR